MQVAPASSPCEGSSFAQIVYTGCDIVIFSIFFKNLTIHSYKYFSTKPLLNDYKTKQSFICV